MNRHRMLCVMGMSIFSLLFLQACEAASSQKSGTKVQVRNSGTMIIDDFTSETASGFPKSKWAFTADTVMGGASEGRMVRKNVLGVPLLQITGSVKAKDGAGFLLASLDLGTFDASGFGGISVAMRGNGEVYSLYLKTADCEAAWQFYEAEIKTDRAWKVHSFAFSDFVPQGLDATLERSKITQVGLISNGRSVEVEVSVARFSFCENPKRKLNSLSSAEKAVILQRGTERAFTGQYEKNEQTGTYSCKHCGTALFESSGKFESHCGWPSFDEAIAGAVLHFPDPDGQRIEIVCAECSGHLGHVFYGEQLTAKDTRYCVNSISLDFSNSP